jgi:hypothetical protein
MELAFFDKRSHNKTRIHPNSGIKCKKALPHFPSDGVPTFGGCPFSVLA